MAIRFDQVQEVGGAVGYHLRNCDPRIVREDGSSGFMVKTLKSERSGYVDRKERLKDLKDFQKTYDNKQSDNSVASLMEFVEDVFTYIPVKEQEALQKVKAELKQTPVTVTERLLAIQNQFYLAITENESVVNPPSYNGVSIPVDESEEEEFADPVGIEDDIFWAMDTGKPLRSLFV